MRPLHPSQIGLALKDAIFRIPLVTLTTFTARDPGQVKATYHLSDRPIVFNGFSWKPHVFRIGELREVMGHVQRIGSGEGSGLSRSLEVEFTNGLFSNVVLWEDLKINNHVSTRIEWAELLLDNPDAAEWTSIPPTLDGDEATVFFRGEFESVSLVTAARFSMRFQSPLPLKPPKALVGNVDTDPRDQGATVSTIFGQMKNALLLNVDTPGAASHFYLAGSADNQVDVIGTVKGLAKSNAGLIDVNASVTAKDVANVPADFGMPTAFGNGATVELATGAQTTIAASLADPEPEAGRGFALFCDVDGVEAPSSLYVATAGVVMTKLVDFFRYITENFLEGVSVDEANLSAVNTDLGTNVHAFILEALGDGESLESMITHLAYEGGVNVCLVERGDETQLLLSTLFATAGDWGPRVVDVTEFQACAEAAKSELDTRTRFLGSYDWEPYLGPPGESRFYSSILQVDEVRNDLGPTTPLPDADITTAQNSFGARDAPRLLYRTIRDSATAKDILHRHVRVFMSADPIFNVVGVPHPQSYRLELGDLVEFIPPTSLTPTNPTGVIVKARVLEVVKRQDGPADLVVIQVDTS